MPDDPEPAEPPARLLTPDEIDWLMSQPVAPPYELRALPGVIPPSTYSRQGGVT